MTTTYDKDGAYIEVTTDGVVHRRSIKWEDCIVSFPTATKLKIDRTYINDSDQLVLVLTDESEITLSASDEITEHAADVDAHHAKYLNSEAKAAAVLAGAITDGETKAPTHDAVYEVKVVADAAQTAAEVDDDIATHAGLTNPHTVYILHSLATAVSDFLVASGVGVFVKKTLAETLTVLGKAAASGLASLNASTKVVEQPASITDHLDGSPDEDDATKAPTSEWAFDHAANTTTAHGAVSAATASKIVVRDASARAKFAAAATVGDAIVADANVRAPDSTLLEGSSKATVQDHTPKAHTIVSHSDTTGTGAELDELTDGSETTLHSHAAAGACMWTLAETLSPSAVTSIDSSTLDAHDLWMVLIDIWAYAASAAEEYVRLIFNDDGGANYTSRIINSTTTEIATGEVYLTIGSMRSDALDHNHSVGQLLITGKGHDRAADKIAITGMFGASGTGYNYDRILNGSWKCGTADVTKFGFLFGAAMTGKIFIYYKDY